MLHACQLGKRTFFYVPSSRTTTNTSLLMSVGEVIQNSFEDDMNSFLPSLVVIATWENVGNFERLHSNVRSVRKVIC